MYKGYIKTNSKKALEKFKGINKFKNLQQISKEESYAGVLSENTVLVDIDNYDDSEILYNMIMDMKIKCKITQTKKGKHFIFLNSKDVKGDRVIQRNKTNTSLACGIHADIKCGHRDSYQILKIDGKVRNVLLDEEPEEIPFWLKPITNSYDFKNMEEGDGRNQQLFNYILILQKNSFSIDQCKVIIRNINKYIMVDPLDEKELAVILRDESFSAPIFYDQKTFLHANFARYLIANNHVIKINNQLHLYRDGYYTRGDIYIENEMIKLIDHLTKQKRNEVLNWLNAYICDSVKSSDARYIGFNNGIYDIFENKLIPFSPDIIITNKINYDYIENTKSELVDNTLNKLACNDIEIKKLLEEVIGYCLYRRNELGKAFILIGDKSNGKSTFLDMIKTMLGEDNISSLDLGELGDRFKTAELFSKLANIGDDIGDDFIPNPAIFKKLVTGDRLSAERKGQDPFEFNNYSKMLFSANNIPRIKDKTGAVLRRLCIIPFNATFSVNDKDYRPYIKYELREEPCMQHLIQLGISGLKRVLKNQKFTEPTKVKNELKEYEYNNNPVMGFFDEVGLNEILNEPTKNVYLKYTVYCAENGMNAMSKIEFSKQVKKVYNLEIADKKINGKKYRIFKKSV